MTRTKYPDEVKEQVVREILEKERTIAFAAASFRPGPADRGGPGSTRYRMDRHQGPDPGHHRRYQGENRLQPNGAPRVSRGSGNEANTPAAICDPGGNNVGRGATTALVGVSHDIIEPTEAYSMNRVE